MTVRAMHELRPKSGSRPYYMDIHEVTTAEYEVCVKDKSCQACGEACTGVDP